MNYLSVSNQRSYASIIMNISKLYNLYKQLGSQYKSRAHKFLQSLDQKFMLKSRLSSSKSACQSSTQASFVTGEKDQHTDIQTDQKIDLQRKAHIHTETDIYRRKHRQKNILKTDRQKGIN